MEPPPSWPRRFINASPPMPDSVFVGFILVMVFLLGIAVGLTWCSSTQQREGQRVSVQHQLDALERRLKAVEQR